MLKTLERILRKQRYKAKLAEILEAIEAKTKKGHGYAYGRYKDKHPNQGQGNPPAGPQA